MTDKAIQIDIIQDTIKVMTFHPATKKEAAKIYFAHLANTFEYTLLTVGKREYTTAQAKRFFRGFTANKVPISLS